MFGVFEANNTAKNSTLQKCMNKSINTSQFDITYHAIPTAQPCTEESDKPCEASWISEEYESKTWHPKADMATCQSCTTNDLRRPL